MTSTVYGLATSSLPGYPSPKTAAITRIETHAAVKVPLVRVYGLLHEPPGADWDTLRKAGHGLVISVAPWTDDGHLSWKDLAAAAPGSPVGNMIEAWRRTLSAWANEGTRIWLVFNHEPDVPVTQRGTPTEFRAAWRRWANVMRLDAKARPNLRLTLCLSAWSYKNGVADGYWPGSRYVDVVGADGYNWWTYQRPPVPWRGPEDVFSGVVSFAKRHGRPWAAPEVGSPPDPADPNRRREWIDQLRHLAERTGPEHVCWFDHTDLETRAPWGLSIPEYGRFLQGARTT